MKNLFGSLVIGTGFLLNCYQQPAKLRERDYQKNWCLARGGQIEVVMPDKTRCDCLTRDYAIEIDFAGKWAEAIGQSLHYARLTGKKPGVVLICKKRKERRHLLKVQKLGIKIWSINCEKKDLLLSGG